MSNLFAWASIGENGHATGGKKGDQTGKEVKIGEYYDFGQDCVIRCKTKKYRYAIANAAELIAKDDSTGYNQDERGTLFVACSKLDWNINKIKKAMKKGTFPKCNTDCSAFYATCINIAYGKRMVDCFTTATCEANTVKKYPKQFEKISVNYAKEKWHKGDAPLKAGKHVIINI